MSQKNSGTFKKTLTIGGAPHVVFGVANGDEHFWPYTAVAGNGLATKFIDLTGKTVTVGDISIGDRIVPSGIPARTIMVDKVV
jgi:hypothetical protein